MAISLKLKRGERKVIREVVYPFGCLGEFSISSVQVLNDLLREDELWACGATKYYFAAVSGTEELTYHACIFPTPEGWNLRLRLGIFLQCTNWKNG